MKSKPLVSVLMPVYNAEKYLKEAIDSILNQTFKDFEFIIINDGSTDSSLSIIKKYTDPRIILISRKNKGLVDTLNEGLELAKGKYIARMDADDISDKNRFKKQVAFMEKNPEIDLLGSQIMLIDSNGNSQGVVYKPISTFENYIYIAYGSTIAHPSAMYRRSLKIVAGGYKVKYWPAEDYDLWGRIIKKRNTNNLPEVLLHYRINNQGISLTTGSEQLRKARKISDKLFNSIGQSIFINPYTYIRLKKIENKNQKMIRGYTMEPFCRGLLDVARRECLKTQNIPKKFFYKIKIKICQLIVDRNYEK